MQRRTILFLNLAIILSLTFSGILSGILIPTPVVTGASSAPAVAPEQAIPDFASRRVKRDRKHDRIQQDRQQKRKQKDRIADRKQRDKKHARQQDPKKGEQTTDQGRVGDWKDQCAGPGTVRLTKTELCTHGPDPVPPGLASDQPAAPSSASEAGAESPPIECETDGQTGFRVQVLYVHESSSPALSDDLRATIRGYVGDMDQIFEASAIETGLARNLRFVHDESAHCLPTVDDVTVTTAALSDFDTMIAQLENKGYDDAHRIYLSFANANTYCGIGTLWRDDDADGVVNWNNFGPSYSRVDSGRGCWTGWVAAHEVMHNLGGVQPSAPFATPGFHCIDEYDIMCYSDVGQGVPQMQDVCHDIALNTTRFDCNDDAYYNTDPDPNSYLDTHWNPANNRFLIGSADAALPADFQSPRVDWIQPVGNNERFGVDSGQVALEAAATDENGIASVEFWRYDNNTEDWIFISEDFTEPYQSSIDAGVLSAGGSYLSADAYDTSGRYDYELILLDKASPTVASPVDPPTSKDKKKDKKKKHKGKHKRMKRR